MSVFGTSLLFVSAAMIIVAIALIEQPRSTIEFSATGPKVDLWSNDEITAVTYEGQPFAYTAHQLR